MQYETISDACHAWVNEFNAIPQSVLEKLNEFEGWESVREITPLHKYSKVRVVFDEYAGEEGEIIDTNYDGESDLYVVRLDSDPDDPKIISGDCLEEVFTEGYFPMWGTMWQFGDKIDEEWLVGSFGKSHLQEMADIGFRIYEQEDYGIVFGIDAAGFDFYEAYWIPLYKARGLHWHKIDETEKVEA